MALAQLIPGLPNDLAIQCLLCLSSQDLLHAQEVSSLWKIAIISDRFYVERRLRVPYPSICVIGRFGSSFQILDIEGPNLVQNRRLLYSCDVQTGKMLFPPGIVFTCIGASIFTFAPGHQVQKFSLITRRWITVRKTMPPQCKLFATSFGKHVVVLACKHYVTDDDASSHARDVDDGVLRHAVCEIFDSENNRWASLEGLPDAFAGTHCVTCEGILYVRGKASDRPVSVYALNLSKKRWEENVHMRDRMQFVLHDCKVIIKPDAVLMASRHSDDTVHFQHQQAGATDWIHVVTVNVVPHGDFFILEEGDKKFLAFSDAGLSWRARKHFYYHGLTTLHIPSVELLMVESVCGKAYCGGFNTASMHLVCSLFTEW